MLKPGCRSIRNVIIRRLAAEANTNYTRGNSIQPADVAVLGRKLRCYTRAQVIARQILNYLQTPERLRY